MSGDRRTIRRLEDEIESWKDDVEKLEDGVERLEDDVDRLERELNKCRKTILNMTHDSWTKSEDYKQQHNMHHRELRKKDQLIESLRDDLDNLHRETEIQLENKDKSVIKLTSELTEARKTIAQLSHDNGRLHQDLRRAAQQNVDNDQQYNKAIERLSAKLKQSNVRAATLQQKVAEDEEKLSRVYTAAVSTFARNVSRDLPDDIVKGSLSTFFHGDFFSWCADLCVPQIAQPEPTLQHLRSIGIINSYEAYLEAPKYLHFDMNLLDGSSPLLLLQAALAKALCGAFLTSPFFLARQREAFEVFAQELARGDRTASVDWRIQTVASLEAIAPFDPITSASYARQFEQNFKFLLKELDDESRDDLGKLFTDFAQLALRLWKLRTNIAVFNMPSFADTEFELGSKIMDGEPSTVSSLGQKLNGRPIGVVMRPLIISTPVVPEGGQPHEVVWSKALVWVSPHVCKVGNRSTTRTD